MNTSPSSSVPDHIHMDPIGGISGDMFVAAMLDATQCKKNEITEVLKSLGVPKGLSIKIKSKKDARMNGRKFCVEGPLQGPNNIEEICNFLANSEISNEVQDVATHIFKLLGHAEAKVHGIKIEKVHLHEVGNWDSIVDIVLAGYFITKLAGCSWSSSPIPIGEGFVNCDHGNVPLPAPATAELLKGMYTRHDGITGERTTPTGAAILKYLSPSPTGTFNNRKLIGFGTGFGSRTFDQFSNILRIFFYNSNSNLNSRDEVGVISFTVDDQTPEDLAYGLESIRSLDFTYEVSQVSSFGKKNRISAKIEVVCDPLYIDEAANACFEQTSTIGLRTRLESRYVLHRMTEKLSLNGYDVRAKFVSRPSKISTVKLESRDLDNLKLNFAQRSQLRYEASMIRPDWGVMGGDQQDE